MGKKRVEKSRQVRKTNNDGSVTYVTETYYEIVNTTSSYSDYCDAGGDSYDSGSSGSCD